MKSKSKLQQPRSFYIEYLEKRIAPATFVVTNLNDAGIGSLRDAVDRANATPGVDTITFRGDAASGEIALTSGDIDITDSVNIRGPGATKLAINAHFQSRIFNIDDGTAAVKSTTISGLSIVGGSAASGNGGGILSMESLTLVNSVVSGCRSQTFTPGSDGYGGGLDVVTAGKLVIRNCKIVGNTAEAGAGGIRADADGGTQVINTTISGNSANRQGGGIYARITNIATGEILITGSTITGNTASSGGGIVAFNFRVPDLDEAGKITIRGTLISGNSATLEDEGAPHKGGGVYVLRGNLLVDRCTIIGNIASDGGGGLSTELVDSLVIRNSDIVGNRTTSATGAGGGISIEGNGKNAIIQNTFLSNNASGDGGGVFSLGNRLTVQSSTITGNTAVTDGGGIYAKQGLLNIARSTMSGNQAGVYGGGIETKGIVEETTTVRITRSLFTVNRAGEGGAIDTHGEGSITIVGSRFTQNTATADEGGGAYLRSYVGTISITDSLFAQNTAATGGGGIALLDKTSSIIITNTVVRDNVAARDGGGVALTEGILEFRNSTVSGNIAGGFGGGISNRFFAPIALNGSKVTGNIATTDPQIAGPFTP